MSRAAPERIPSSLPVLACPGCGGRTTPGPAGRYDCAYCGGHFLAAAGHGVPTLAPARQLGAAAALHAARAWLREQEIATQGPLRPDAVSLLYVPYWRYQALAAGWLLLQRRRRAAAPSGDAGLLRALTATPESGPAGAGPAALGLLARRPDRREAPRDLFRLASRDDEGQRLAAWLAQPAAPEEEPAAEAGEPFAGAVLRPVSWSGPGCDVRELGLVGLARPLPPEELVPFDFGAAERTGAICQVTGSVATVRRQAERAILNQLGAPARLLRRRTCFIRERLELVYYPLHVVKYRAAGLACRLTVDGLSGAVLSGSRPAPGRDGRGALAAGIYLWSCLWSASPAAGAGALPLLWLWELARGRATGARGLLRRAQAALRPLGPRLEQF